MEWNWDHAFAVLPQLADGLVVTIQATIVASLLLMFWVWGYPF